MRQGVVVATSFRHAEPCRALLASLAGCRYPIAVVMAGPRLADPAWLEHLADHYRLISTGENEWEVGAIRAVLDHTDLDEFVLFQDTFEIKDPSFLDEVFAFDGTVLLTVAGFHYNLKWRREVLDRLAFPVVASKSDSVYYEGEFTRRYLAAETKPVWTFDPSFHDGNAARFEEKWGRLNMVIENDWYLKRKGDWGQRSLAGR